MNFLDNIEHETLIICSDNTKKNILRKHLLKPIKIMNVSSFRKKYMFSYSEDAILYVMNEYKFKYQIAKEYIDNLYYVDDIQYNNSKLDVLVDIKRKLDDNNLLEYNDKFHEYLKRVDIILYHLSIDKNILKLFNGLNYKIINREYNEYDHKVYEFSSIEDEVFFVAKKISSIILEHGIPINKIKLAGIDQSYYNVINRIFGLFNLKVNIAYESSLGSYKLVKEFIDRYKNSDNIDDILGILGDDKISLEIVKVINKYREFDNKELLIYKLENTKIKSDEYTGAIEIIDVLDYETNDDEYVFMLGFNDGLIPKYSKDTEYITDNLSKILDLDTSFEKNIMIKDTTIRCIRDIKNLTISYKLHDYKRKYYPSSLVGMFEVTRELSDDSISYSANYDKIRLIDAYDNYFKFGYKNDYFDLLGNNYKVQYNSYDNKYHRVNNKKKYLTLSYSKMQTYNECQFRYYIDNILGLNIYQENFSAYIGKMFHYVLEKSLSLDDYDVSKHIAEFTKDRSFTNKEKFFLDKYALEIKDFLDAIILEKQYMKLNQAKYEEKVNIDYDNDTHFVGIIDKILYYYDGVNTYISLVDYKTGNDEITLDYLDSGLYMQLPIYLYLASKMDFKNPVFCGFYLQKFDISKKDYRLLGYSNSDSDILEVIDNNYQNSVIIRGLKVNKDGTFSKNAKLLSSDEMRALIDKVDVKIKDTIKSIRDDNFDINPKMIEDKNISCRYCKYKDICYMTNGNLVTIDEHAWGGDSDGIYE